MPRKRTAQPPPVWANRIVRYGEESPDQLLAHEKNWRIHTHVQEEALRRVFETVGVTQNIIVSERSGKCLDGHLRISMAISAGQPTLPVTYVDVTPEEESLVLATFDRITAMAGVDQEKLDELVAESVENFPDLSELLGTVEQRAALPSEFKEFNESAADDVKYLECPQCGHKFPA